VNMKVAAALIVLTAAGTFVIVHPRRHHFEQTKLDSVLLDTDTGVRCSAVFSTKWTDADEAAVQAAELVLREAKARYDSSVTKNFPQPGD
jgi:MinD superfamily P-loop ATPase